MFNFVVMCVDNYKDKCIFKGDMVCLDFISFVLYINSFCLIIIFLLCNSLVSGLFNVV